MALTSVVYSDVASSLATIFQDSLVEQFNRSVVLSKLLPFKEAVGKNLSWDAQFGTLPASSVLADGADVADYNDDLVVPATLNFGTYSEAFSVSGKALAAAAAANNPRELANLFGDKMELAVTRLAANINKHWYTGSGASDTIMGLTATNGGLKATGTYATIDRAVQTLWAGNELLNGAVPRALSFKLMRDARKAIYDASGMMPDLIVCDSFQHEQYGLLFGDQRRYVQDITLRGRNISLDGGYRALEFDGIPVIADIHCPAGMMLFLNTSKVCIRQLGFASAPGGDAGTVRLHGTAEEQLGDGMTGLMAKINPLSRTGDKYPFQLVLYPQLQVMQPNSCAILGDLLTS